MKTLVHSLTDEDTLGDAPTNATGDELKLFADDAAEWGQTNWKKLWVPGALPADDERHKVPTSWTIDKAAPEDGWASKWRIVRKACIKELDRRAQPGNKYGPDVLSSTMLQFPKGRVEDGEDVWATAQRELEEEAGVLRGDIARLPSLLPGENIIRGLGYTYYVCCIPQGDKAAMELESWLMDDSKETTGAEWVNLDLLGETSVQGGIYLPKKEKAVAIALRKRSQYWQQQLLLR
jgi:8-oxo-dGTP pyrophosphatase MutT (NUDIX family)